MGARGNLGGESTSLLEGCLEQARARVRAAAQPLLFQILCLEPGKQHPQQEEEELQKLPAQPPYYGLGTSPPYCPLVRTSEP